MVELTEVMRQRGDFEFISLLNEIREREIDDHVENIFKSPFLKEKSFPQYAVHMFAEKIPAKEHNENQLNALNTKLILMKFQRILFYHKVRLMQLNKGR